MIIHAHGGARLRKRAYARTHIHACDLLYNSYVIVTFHLLYLLFSLMTHFFRRYGTHAKVIDSNLRFAARLIKIIARTQIILHTLHESPVFWFLSEIIYYIFAIRRTNLNGRKKKKKMIKLLSIFRFETRTLLIIIPRRADEFNLRNATRTIRYRLMSPLRASPTPSRRLFLSLLFLIVTHRGLSGFGLIAEARRVKRNDDWRR